MTLKNAAEQTLRLKNLRKSMAALKLDGYLVPRQDEFQGEYVAAYANRLQWVSGFSGSWGIAVIGMKQAAIFVDGRYTVQVREEVNAKLIEPRHLITDPPTQWISSTFKKAQKKESKGSSYGLFD